jgi:hypothetical protein
LSIASADGDGASVLGDCGTMAVGSGARADLAASSFSSVARNVSSTCIRAPSAASRRSS